MKTTRGWSSRRFAGFSLVLVGLLTIGATAPIEPNLLGGLRWRNIGPFRGGRISAVTGVIGQPGVFYAGLPLGGVWKTTSAGVTWFPIFDDIKEVSTVGAIEVAPSDPNVIYVGTGDLITGGGINEGNGVYKSTDAGKTWKHLGLDDTKQISAILVDPKDPNIVLIAAQGNIHTHTDMRGVFRSTDGGKTWAKTLYIDNETGIQRIAWAYDRPSVILATTVKHYIAPGAGPGGAGAAALAPGPNAPSGTATYISHDQGVTWTPVTGGGLPEPLIGRTGVAIAANTNAQRMFLVGPFGLYRSDDGGKQWRRMDGTDRRISCSNYICDVYVNTKNPDIIYTLNTSSYQSMDGGTTFHAFKGAPGGDDPHNLWIDPTDGNRLFLGVDQGATISLDGGQTWSSWYNQNTAQVYHISTDNSFPYWVYATQQDAGSIQARSRGDLGAITPFDWFPHPGYEFGSIVADPLDPNITYAGGPGGGIIKASAKNGQWINVSANIDTSLGLRKVGNQPMQWSLTNPHELLVGFQAVLATTDGGQHWKALSPDLGYPKGETPPPRTAPAGRGGGRGGGGSIESMSTSSVAPGIIWAGTNNGLIKLTKNHGATWEDVTIAGLPNPTRADISAIDASHHDAGTAYVAIDYHTTGEYRPFFYRTRDFGKTWTQIISGMRTDQPSGSFARVIRADTKRAGLLFAGTESSVYVSFNDGDDWQSLMLNLPNTSYRDMTIKDNDLVVGTYGRSFYILDDISPLRQITPAIVSEPAHLFKPGDAYRTRRNTGGDTPFPPEVPHAQNPPVGALIYYYLGQKPAADIVLEILDASGKVVRHMTSAPFPPNNDPPPNVPDYWLEKPHPMPAEIGTNRINWNTKYDPPGTFTHNYSINANFGETPAGPEGPLALPGVYTARLTVDGKSYSQTFTVKNDPRSPVTAAELRAQHDLLMKVYAESKEAWDGYNQVAAVRGALAEATRTNLPADVAAAVTALNEKLVSVGGDAGAGRGRGGGGANAAAAGPPPAPNFAALVGSLNRELTSLDPGDINPTEPMLKAHVSGCNELKAAVVTWNGINAKDVAALSALLSKMNLKPIKATPLAVPVCAATAAM